MPSEPRPTGVVFLDHTADVGLRVRAPTPEELFRRAAAGTRHLLEGDGAGDGDRGAFAGSPEAPGRGGNDAPGDVSAMEPDPRRVILEADDLSALLRAWLREVLWWHEVEGLALREVRFDRLDARRLEAEVRLEGASEPVREIKGVTLHGLAVEEEGGAWRAQVIFDV